MTSCARKCPADLIRGQKSVDVHQNPAHTSPTHLSTHSYPTLISKKHHMLTSREKCGLSSISRMLSSSTEFRTNLSPNSCSHDSACNKALPDPNVNPKIRPALCTIMSADGRWLFSSMGGETALPRTFAHFGGAGYARFTYSVANAPSARTTACSASCAAYVVFRMELSS